MKGPDSKDTKEFHQELFDVEDEMIDFINNMKQKSIKKSDQGKVLQFLKKNPNPPDKKIHALADRLGIEPDKLESKIYSILSDVIEHGKGEKVDSKELSMGIEIESEHTKYPELAEAIARAHLKEIPDYYTRLKKMEDEYKKETKKAIYPGNMGFAEMYRFMSEARPGAVSRFNWYLKHDKYHDAIKLLESHISNKFHPSIEKQLLPSHKDPHVKRWMHVIQKSTVKGFVRTKKGKLERVKEFERKGEKAEDAVSSINWRDITLAKLPVGYTWGGGKQYTIYLKDKELIGPSSRSPWAGNYVGITKESKGKEIHITLQRSLQGKGLGPKLIKAVLKEVGDAMMSSDEIANPNVYKIINKLKNDREVKVTEEQSGNRTIYRFHLKVK